MDQKRVFGMTVLAAQHRQRLPRPPGPDRCLPAAPSSPPYQRELKGFKVPNLWYFLYPTSQIIGIKDTEERY